MRGKLRGMQLACALAAVTGLAFARVAKADISFIYDYSANTPGVGFLDPTFGLARQTALTTAGSLFSDLFETYFSNDALITLTVTSTDNPGSSTLASAFSDAVFAPGTFGGGEVVRNKVQSGVDLNGAANDGGVDVNWGYAWELDPNTPAVGPGPGQTFDFYAALFHEYTHALGFGSEIFGNQDRFSQGAEGSGTQGSWAKWDQFLVDDAFTPLINTATFEVNQSALSNAQANGGNFIGPNALAAYLGNPVPLFPNPDQSHLDETTFSTPNVPENYMMKPQRDYGSQEARVWHPLEVGILTDLGYTPVQAAAVIPEPGSLTFVLIGVVGLVRRRRREAVRRMS